jgi:hypothetical protein
LDTGCPQEWQKRASGSSWVPQLEQRRGKAAPQLKQNLAPSGFEVLHFWHSIDQEFSTHRIDISTDNMSYYNPNYPNTAFLEYSCDTILSSILPFHHACSSLMSDLKLVLNFSSLLLAKSPLNRLPWVFGSLLRAFVYCPGT